MGLVSYGSYNELDFLTSLRAQVFDNSDNTDTIWGNLKSVDKLTKETVVFKGKNNYNTDTIKKHYASITDDDDLNQYSHLIKYFASSKTFNSLKLSAAHLVYLKNLGVYPMNRLWILRRFAEGVIVPDNLTDWETNDPPQPIATVIGWVKPTESEFMTIGFNETWTTSNSRFYNVLSEMMDKEFLINTGKIADVPGFAQGLLVGFLHEMKLTSEFNADNLPMGQPNILSEGATRMTDPYDSSMKLISNISFNLTTDYEQKFIGDVDPGSAMLDILFNLKQIGTSDAKYLFDKNSDVIKSLLAAANAKNSAELWINVVSTTVRKFNDAVTNVFNNVKKEVSKISTAGSTGFGGLASDAVKTIMSSTIAKWKWSLIGAIAGDTGLNSTPWHLTLGNPYSPFFSMGNILVKNVEIKMGNEFSFNDMPTDISVSISLSQARNMGGQEIMNTFNNGYIRTYEKSQINAK